MHAFVMYAASKITAYYRRERFRIYVCDVLGGAFGVEVRYSDIDAQVHDFDPEQVVDDVIARAGLEVK